jgi:hypothetical protein
MAKRGEKIGKPQSIDIDLSGSDIESDFLEVLFTIQPLHGDAMSRHHKQLS